MDSFQTASGPAADVDEDSVEESKIQREPHVTMSFPPQPPTMSGHVRINSQVERLHQTLVAAGVQDSLDDDEMREFDPREHFETLGAGIPQHLAQKTGPRYIKPRQFDSTDDETASLDYCGTGDSADELELSPVFMQAGCSSSCSTASQTIENAGKVSVAAGDRFIPDVTSLKVGGASCGGSAKEGV